MDRKDITKVRSITADSVAIEVYYKAWFNNTI